MQLSSKTQSDLQPSAIPAGVPCQPDPMTQVEPGAQNDPGRGLADNWDPYQHLWVQH